MNKDELKIDVIGKIVEGKAQNWFLLIKEDFEDSGGYLILISKDPNMSKYAEGYDYWAEDKDTLMEIFKEAKWNIQWFDEKSN